MNPLYIVWNEDQHIGIPILDEQHHAIVATINSLYFFIQEGWGVSALKPTLNIIKVYSAFHAKTEEGLLLKLQYPSLVKHIDNQKQFEKAVDAIAEEAISYRDPQILLSFLRNWWRGHLLEEHNEYVEYFDKLKK